MKHNHSLRLKTQILRSFSLIEIMVVVAIIGLLAGVVAVNVMDAQEKSNVAVARTQMANIVNALDLFKLDNKKYPQSLDELLGRYIRAQEKPVDPWGTPYIYVVDESDADRPFTIISYGADKKQGGDGYNADITNWDTNAK